MNDRPNPLVVAVAGSIEDLAGIRELSEEAFDLCEIRIDLLFNARDKIAGLVDRISTSKILTVRDPLEGGAHDLSEEVRLELYQTWLSRCDYLDVELRNLSRYSGIITQAEAAGKQIVVSYHDFSGAPTMGQLREMLAAAATSERRIFKVAAKTDKWPDLEILAQFLHNNPSRRIAAMGMGKLGKVSRILLPKLGSVFVYGSVAEAVVPGQWSVTELKTILSKI
jgi:3-dehydroquinate dehydratase I